MCIRDSAEGVPYDFEQGWGHVNVLNCVRPITRRVISMYERCLLYTSDAADERSSVDLGGRRIIKKKNSRYRLCVEYT